MHDPNRAMLPPPTDADQQPPPRPGPRSRLRAKAESLTARGQAAMARLERERPRHVSVEIVFRVLVRDKQVAGGVLGGGLAYRLFFWTLALAVLVCGGLGWAASAGENIDTAMQDAGLTAAVASTISSAAQQSESGRWWLITIGTFSFLWFSVSMLRALRLVHAAAWGITPPPMRNLPRALACVVLMPVVLAALAALAGAIRSNTSTGGGLAAVLAVGALFAAAWLVASSWLPSPDVPWTAFLPGAVVFGLGLEVLHLFTVYFLANKLAGASAVYGALGLATTMLFYLFLIGRSVIWAAELNAVVWTVRTEREAGPAE